MVYCPKCGTKNESDAEFCKKCGENLRAPSAEVKARPRGGTCFGQQERRERHVDECFGVPRLGAVFGILVGILIILLGVGFVLSRHYRVSIEIWPLVVVIFGVIVVVAAASALRRRQ